MNKPKSDVLQGTLALLVLKTLARGPMHGYGITLHIQQVSREVLPASAAMAGIQTHLRKNLAIMGGLLMLA